MTPGPDRPGPELTPESRRKVRRAALRRPMALLMVAIGAFYFAATLEWWVPLLTLATYAALVLLAVRDPIFQNRVLGDTGQEQRAPRSPRRQNSSPEQRARRLGVETRLMVERALEARASVLVAVEESDEATQAALEEALPKLLQLPERLLDVAETREMAAAEAQTQRSRTARSGDEENSRTLASLEENMRAADARLSSLPDDLLALRAKVVRASIEGGEATARRATEFDEALDALNRRLDALYSTLSASAER